MRLHVIVIALGFVTGGASAQATLEVPGHGPASFVPAEGDGPRPVVVALHGNFDRPEWTCAAWRPVVAGRAFLLCPRGVPRIDAPALDRWALPDAPALRREIAAARAALGARFSGRVDDGPDIYVGFSQGAHRVAQLAAEEPERYPRIQLVEGGRALWRRPRRYRTSGGRVAFVCAMAWCEQRGTHAARIIGRSPARARLERRNGAHADVAVMAPAIRETFEWLIVGDARFAP